MQAGRLRGLITFASRAVTSAVSILNIAECADRDNQPLEGGNPRESKIQASFFQPRNGPTSWQFHLQPASASLPETSTPPKPVYRPPGRPRKEARVSAEVLSAKVPPPAAASESRKTDAPGSGLVGPASVSNPAGLHQPESALSAMVDQYGDSSSDSAHASDDDGLSVLKPGPSETQSSAEKVS